MDILMVCHYGLYQDLSFSFVHAQAKAYADLGHNVRVIIPIAIGKSDAQGRKYNLGMTQTEQDGVTLYYLRYLSLSQYGEKRFNVGRAYGAVRRHWKAITADFSPVCIHAHTLGFDSQLATAIKKRLGCPLLVTTHGSDTSIPHKNGQLEALRGWCDSADCVVAVSTALANKVRACNTQTRIEVILNGFRLQHLPTKQNKKPFSLIQVGHLNAQKQGDVTIRAFSLLAKEYPQATLTLIGQGPMRERWQALCTELGVADKVFFLGQIPNDRVLAEMAGSQFFVMPSVGEGFGIVYLEAMACGCITIGTKGEGIADLIEHEVNGFLVAPQDPEAIVQVITSCLQDPQAAQTIAVSGQTAATELTWETNAKHYIELIEEIVK
ncbi:MAG: glycosyltransferase [Clostridia bacterium]|nr:glycosyltransferase [Clostridia bacterium]